MLSSSALRQPNTTRQTLWELLGVSSGATVIDIEIAASRLQEAHELSSERDRAWRMLRDPFYRDVYMAYGTVEAVEEAGFLDDRLPSRWVNSHWGDLNWLCTPLDKILARLALFEHGTRKVVLLSTGSFSPLHLGHVDMMEKGRALLESLGISVAGGYFSLSHDAYVSTKYGGEAALSQAHRLQVCHESVADSDWLMVDPWECREAPAPLNFTDVIERMEAYLRKHIPHEDLEVVYVFGGDNAGFAMSFVEQGSCICVGRRKPTPGQQTILDDLTTKRSDHIFYLDSGDGTENISSTAVRKGALEQMPSAARALYEGWRTPRQDGVNARIPYLIRADLDWAIQDWALPEESHSWFMERLAGLIGRAFGRATVPDVACLMRVEMLPRQAQAEHVENLMLGGAKVLNLDVGTPADSALRFSRRFRMADGQVFSRTLRESPEAASASLQLESLEPGEYILVDDDICSGQTLNSIREMLPPNVRVSEVHALSKWSFHERFGANEPYQFHDIVDARDFLLGAGAGGLVVGLPDGQIARVPYMAPYVNLVSRAKLPPSSLAWFNQQLWQLNKEFFSKWAPTLTVAHAGKPCQNLLGYLGFTQQCHLSEVCDWHLARS